MISQRFRDDGKIELELNQTQKIALYHFVKEIDEKKIEFDEVDCDCGCNSSDLISIAEKDRYAISVGTKICPRCGMIIQSPRMDKASNEKFYRYFYREIYGGSKVADTTFFAEQIKHGHRIMQLIEKEVGLWSEMKILEVGCGAGGILKPFIDKGIHNCFGIDIGDEYLQFGRENGINLINISSSEFAVDNKNEFDLIIMSHVLEHFLDISDELGFIRQMLSESGVLYIEVPGIDSIGTVYGGNILLYLQNAHTRCFSCNTLEQLMRWNGFEKVFSDNWIHSVYKKSRIDYSIINHFDEVYSKLCLTEKEFVDSGKYAVSSNPETKMCKKEAEILCLLDKWFYNYRHGKYISEWLNDRNIKSVAIYGYGFLGRQLFQEIKDAFNVIIIDRRELTDTPCDTYSLNMEIPSVDIIIMTTIADYSTIRREIKSKFNEVMIEPLAFIVMECEKNDKRNRGK